MILCLASILGTVIFACAQEGKSSAPNDAGSRPVFSEGDAVRVMDNVRQGLESDNPRRFLKLFDAKKMPGFAAFRDQISVFFEKFGPMRMTYRVTQVGTEGEFGAAIAEITLDAAAKQATTPNLRRIVPVRVILGWDGKAWKIVDWSPRELFQ